METKEPRWVPIQEKIPDQIDLRNSSMVPRGYKVKNKRKFEEMEVTDDVLPMEADMDAEGAEKPSKRIKSTCRPVSGKIWKTPAQRAGTIMKPKGKKTWDERMKEKAFKAQLNEQKEAAKSVSKDKRKAAAKQRRESEERRKENQKKSEVVQKISNSTTLRKMMKSKKLKKKLKTADTN